MDKDMRALTEKYFNRGGEQSVMAADLVRDAITLLDWLAGSQNACEDNAKRIGMLVRQLNESGKKLATSEARLAQVFLKANKLIALKRSYDCTVDPRVQREYESAYIFIQALAADDAGKERT